MNDRSTSEEFEDASTDYGPLTQRQAENIADLAARRAQERLYAEIGRSVVRKAIFVLGAAGTAMAAWVSGLFTFTWPPKL